jgi:hypothetical protein
MNNNNSARSWLRLTTLAGALMAAGTHDGFGSLIVFDTFDTESVGAFPSTWTNAVVGPSAQIYVTNNIAGTPTSPNVFQVANRNTNEAFTVWRPFSPYSLNVSSQLVVNYKLNVASLPSDFSGGFAIGTGNLPVQGEETFGIIRVLRTSGGWGVLNPYYLSNGGANGVTNGLSFNTWYDFRFEIDPSPTNAQNGVVRWYLNDALINVETTFTVPSLSRTNINSFFVRDTFPGSSPHPETTFYLDNVRIFAEIPEPGALAFVVAGAMLLACRRRTQNA